MLGQAQIAVKATRDIVTAVGEVSATLPSDKLPRTNLQVCLVSGARIGAPVCASQMCTVCTVQSHEAEAMYFPS